MRKVFRTMCAAFGLCSTALGAPADLDFFTNFEDINTPVGVPFSIGDSTVEATFNGSAFAGVAGIGQLYFSGIRAWMVTPQGIGNIDFSRNASQVEFWARTQSSANGPTTITAYDDSNQVVDTVLLSAIDPFQLISFSGNIDRIEVINTATGTRLNAIDDFGFTPLAVAGDFDGSGMLNVADIDLLAGEVREGGANLEFDLNDDGQVNQQDLTQWVNVLANTFFGDANLDRLFDSTDLVQVLQRGEYEDAIAGNSTWEEGDWNGDGDFDSSDLTTALQSGGFEQGPRMGVATAVPEPSTVWLLGAAALVLGGVRKRTPRR